MSEASEYYFIKRPVNSNREIGVPYYFINSEKALSEALRLKGD
jgi:ribosomal protein L7Ae-like RNA K-turn-binding protein